MKGLQQVERDASGLHLRGVQVRRLEILGEAVCASSPILLAGVAGNPPASAPFMGAA